MRAPRTTTRVDRTDDVYGHLTVLSYVRTDSGGRAVWLCRCDCGRATCRGEVERNSNRLRWTRAPYCNAPAARRGPSAPRPAACRVLLPPGVRQPWSRTPGKSAARDALLSRAFAGADPR